MNARAPLLTLIVAIFAGGCSPERPGSDISIEVRDALATGDQYEIRPRLLSNFDCICVFTMYEDAGPGTMESLSRSEEAEQCAIRRVPFDLGDDDGAFLLIDRSTRPPQMEIQSFDRGAAPALSGLTVLYRGCQRAIRARIDKRPGHGILETSQL